MVDCVSVEKEERQRIFSTSWYNTFPHCRLYYCYTYGLLYAGAAYPCRATRFPVQVIHHLRVKLLLIDEYYYHGAA